MQHKKAVTFYMCIQFRVSGIHLTQFQMTYFQSLCNIQLKYLLPVFSFLISSFFLFPLGSAGLVNAYKHQLLLNDFPSRRSQKDQLCGSSLPLSTEPCAYIWRRQQCRTGFSTRSPMHTLLHQFKYENPLVLHTTFLLFV